MTHQASHPAQPDLTCQELVEAVTDYLEGALSPTDLARFERHLGECPACVDYVEQIRQTIGLAGRIEAEQLAPNERERLVALFRSWKDE
jgi:anti-sigma factor RsiW